MRIFKTGITIILTIIIASATAAIAGVSVKAESNTLTIAQHTFKEISVKSDSSYTYSTRITGNTKAVRVDYAGHYDDKDFYNIVGLKTTGKKPASVKIIGKDEITGKKETVKSFTVTVKKPKQTKFKTIRLSKGKNLVGAIKLSGYIYSYSLKIKKQENRKAFGLNQLQRQGRRDDLQHL